MNITFEEAREQGEAMGYPYRKFCRETELRYNVLPPGYMDTAARQAWYVSVIEDKMGTLNAAAKLENTQ